MKVTSLSIFLVILSYFSVGQVINMKFTAQYNGAHVDIDSVRVTNLTHPGDTVLYWPDTTLFLGYEGIENGNVLYHPGFDIKLGSSNPTVEKLLILMFLPKSGSVHLTVSNISGRVLQEISRFLSYGNHQFHYVPSHPGVYIIKVSFKSETRSLKIIYTGKDQVCDNLVFVDGENTSIFGGSEEKYLGKPLQYFVYMSGDSLQLKGWYHGNSTALYTANQSSSSFNFLFGMNFPCPGLPIFTYGTQTYNTVQIGTQCWMKENLNIGTKVISTSTSTPHSNCYNNGIIEKYCYNNDEANCDNYGGLYDWDEMMQYNTIEGAQGICPSGWHLPTDAEWCTLTTYLDETVDCNNWAWSGTDVGGLMKESGLTHWYLPNTGASNESGFTAIGGGIRLYQGEFDALARYATFWSSTMLSSTYVITWELYYKLATINREITYNTYGNSVRCIKD